MRTDDSIMASKQRRNEVTVGVPSQQAVVELRGSVTWTDGIRLEVASGNPPQPRAKLYWDGNPLKLKTGDVVVIQVRRDAARGKGPQEPLPGSIK